LQLNLKDFKRLQLQPANLQLQLKISSNKLKSLDFLLQIQILRQVAIVATHKILQVGVTSTGHS
jgi:hypothetical protein